MPVPATLIEGKYEILGKIREGGMGAIYKVRHRLLDEIRVIKVMRPPIGDDEEMKRRFVQEAKTVTKLKHPNIGIVLDFALDSDGTSYIVMEFIDGVTLADIIRTTGPPAIPLALEITHQTLLALGYLHRRNLVHRDVAPDNIMLARDEEGHPRVKVIDLGIAKVLDKTVEMTSTGVFLGKVKYCSPEQLGGLPKGETLDGRSDIYSLGVVVYEMLTGQRPLRGETPRELFAAHLFNAPAPFSETDPTGRVPEPLRAAVLKALEKKREDRFASADEFDREILRLKSGFGDVEQGDLTMRMISDLRLTPLPPSESAIGSVQDRFDQQFQALTTPTPIKTSGLTAVPPPVSLTGPTVIKGGATPAPTGSQPVPAPALAKSRTPILIGATAVVLALATALYLVLRPKATPLPPPPVERPVPTAAASVSTAPTAQAEAARVEPTAAAAPTAPPETDTRRLSQKAEVATSNASPKSRPTAETVAQVQPTSRAEPARPTAALVIEPPRPPATAPPAPPAAASDQDRISETLRNYEKAQSTLDVDLYARIYVGLTPERRQQVSQAWQSFRSQEVKLDCQPPRITGTSAVVACFERRVAVPRIGIEQRNDIDRTLHLEKRGDSWVITSMK